MGQPQAAPGSSGSKDGLLVLSVFLTGAEPTWVGTGSRIGDSRSPATACDGTIGPPLTRCPRAGQSEAEEDGSDKHRLRAERARLIIAEPAGEGPTRGSRASQGQRPRQAPGQRRHLD
jgi:hypothetical protein